MKKINIKHIKIESMKMDNCASICHDHNYHKTSHIFSCPKCNAKFSSNKALTIHNKRFFHLKKCRATKKLKCKDCKKVYADVNCLRLHVIGGRCTAVEPCKKCGKIFTRLTEYTMHLRYSNSCGATPGKSKCDICHKGFMTSGGLKSHNRSGKYCNLELCRLKAQPEKLMCEVCGKVGFDGENKFKQHMMSHTDDLVCKGCGSKFCDLNKLRRHEQFVCIGDRACSVCGKNKFRSRQDFTRHVQTHDPSFKLENILEVNYICKCKCGLGFTKTKSLTDHVKHACGHGLICEHCGKADFKNKMEFRMHMNGHSLGYSEPDLQDLLCKICFRSFKTQRDKDRHISSVHKGVKNPQTGNYDYFPCDHCNEVVPSMEQLLSHQKAVHLLHDPSISKSVSKRTRVQCNVCKKSFAKHCLPTGWHTQASSLIIASIAVNSSRRSIISIII